MQIVIAGCGRVGSSLAKMLADINHDVTVIDVSLPALESLGKSFNGAVIHGTAYDVDVLRSARIAEADVFVAVTDSDNANLMAVEVTKAVFGVERSIARLYDPKREQSYRALGVKYVTGTKLIAQVIAEQVVNEEFVYHVSFPTGDVQIVEFVVGEQAAGMSIDRIQIKNRLRVAAIQRGDRTIVPAESFELEAGDLVVAAARKGIESRVEDIAHSQARRP